MTFNKYKFLIFSDLFRYSTKRGVFIKHLLLTPGFKYTFWMRTAKYFKTKGLFGIPPYFFSRLILAHYKYKYGIIIPYNTNIGYGLYIGHFGGIVVNYQAQIGNNCNINHGVTIGATYEGKCSGTPTILDKVYLGPGSKIIGGIKIGNNVAVGANCVITKTIPDNAVVVGIPGKIISYKSSSIYIINILEKDV